MPARRHGQVRCVPCGFNSLSDTCAAESTDCFYKSLHAVAYSALGVALQALHNSVSFWVPHFIIPCCYGVIICGPTPFTCTVCCAAAPILLAAASAAFLQNCLVCYDLANCLVLAYLWLSARSLQPIGAFALFVSDICVPAEWLL